MYNMDLADIMLSEIIKSQKDKYYMIPLAWDTEPSRADRKRLPQAGGRVSYCLNGYRVSALSD